MSFVCTKKNSLLAKTDLFLAPAQVAAQVFTVLSSAWHSILSEVMDVFIEKPGMHKIQAQSFFFQGQHAKIYTGMCVVPRFFTC